MDSPFPDVVEPGLALSICSALSLDCSPVLARESRRLTRRVSGANGDQRQHIHEPYDTSINAFSG